MFEMVNQGISRNYPPLYYSSHHKRLFYQAYTRLRSLYQGKFIPAFITFTMVATLYQGSTRAVPIGTMVLLLPWYCMVTIGSGLVTGLVNPPLVFVV